jgi:DNA gyrase subunit A
MRFTNGDELLGMYVVREGADVLVATEGGYAKRTPADEYPIRNRGGLGVITARIVENRGRLVGALMVRPDDEVFAITSAGGVIRTRASEVKQSGRQTMGVRLMNLAPETALCAPATPNRPKYGSKITNWGMTATNWGMRASEVRGSIVTVARLGV